MAKVEVRDVVKRYTAAQEEASRFDRDRPALDHINLTIDDGEIISIVGPSGCGKSTLLRTIAGLEFPTSGQVLYNDFDVTHVEPQQRGIGMVFQDYALYPSMRSKGNLHYYFEVHRRTEAEMEARTHEVARMMGVGFDLLMGQKTDTLSGGEQQRVAIARCIVRDPVVFLMDEPISNLDAKLRESTRMEIKKMLRKFSVTTVYVTHDQQEAIFMADRIVVMRFGKIEQVGTYDDLYYTPANLFVASFIGSPPMSVLPGKREGAALVLEDGKRFDLPGDLAATLPDGAMRLGLRAEGWLVGEGVTCPVRHIERIPTEQAAFIHATIGGVNVTVLASLEHPQVSEVQLAPNWEQVYFFSATDETPLHTPGIPELF